MRSAEWGVIVLPTSSWLSSKPSDIILSLQNNGRYANHGVSPFDGRSE
jgi:hypothetical protein